MTELIEDDFEENVSSDSIVAYQYSDLQKTAKSILSKATETANKKIEQAKKNIYELEEKMRQQGYEKGFEEGVAAGQIEGRKTGEVAARADFEKKVGGLNGALQNILGELNFRKQEIQAQAEADLLNLALEIAKKVVRREIQVDERFVVPILQEAVALTNNKNDLVIRANPEDHKVIEEEIPTLEAIFSDIGRISVVDDDGIERGGVKVRSREGEVDMCLQEQFAALDRALIGDIEGMREWNGQNRTELPIVQDVTAGTVAPSTPEAESIPPVVPPEPEVVPEQNNAKPEAVPVQPSRRRGPRARKNPEEREVQETNSQEVRAQGDSAQENDTTQPTNSGSDSTPIEAPVQAPVDQALQSSLSGVKDMSSLTLASEHEDLIKEVLKSGGDGNNG